MIYSFSFDLPAVMLFCSKQNINNSSMGVYVKSNALLRQARVMGHW